MAVFITEANPVIYTGRGTTTAFTLINRTWAGLVTAAGSMMNGEGTADKAVKGKKSPVLYETGLF